MGIETKFASRRKGFLAQSHPNMYATLVKDGTLNEHLDKVGLEASQMMDHIVQQMMPQVEAIADPNQKEIRLAQIELMAEECALNDIVLTL